MFSQAYLFVFKGLLFRSRVFIHRSMLGSLSRVIVTVTYSGIFWEALTSHFCMVSTWIVQHCRAVSAEWIA
jgi:hypothetical protein